MWLSFRLLSTQGSASGVSEYPDQTRSWMIHSGISLWYTANMSETSKDEKRDAAEIAFKRRDEKESSVSFGDIEF